MEKIINSFAEYIALELNLDKDKKEIIAYGAFALVQTGVSILLIIIFGIIFKCIIEALIILFTVSILRRASGGVHASSPERCILLGTVICIGEALIAKKLIYQIIDVKLLIVIEIIIFTFSYITITKLAPLDNPKKPIKNIKKRKKMKKLSLTILSVYLFVVVFTIYFWLYTGLNNWLIYNLCIGISVLWQVFTLTFKGHTVVSKLDSLLKILI